MFRVPWAMMELSSPESFARMSHFLTDCPMRTFISDMRPELLNESSALSRHWTTLSMRSVPAIDPDFTVATDTVLTMASSVLEQELTRSAEARMMVKNFIFVTVNGGK
jgi:hypothetical protein